MGLQEDILKAIQPNLAPAITAEEWEERKKRAREYQMELDLKARYLEEKAQALRDLPFLESPVLAQSLSLSQPPQLSPQQTL